MNRSAFKKAAQIKPPLFLAPPEEAEPPEPTIKAIVLPNNSYGGIPPGAIVEVTARELGRVPHALEELEHYRKRTAAEESTRSTADSGDRSLYDRLNGAWRTALRQAEQFLIEGDIRRAVEKEREVRRRLAEKK